MANYNNNTERFEKFKQTGFKWSDRFIWRGKYGCEMYTTISIEKFNEDTRLLKNLSFKNTLDFYHQMVKISQKYSEWCKNTFNLLTDDMLNELQLFFIGCVGEFFFVQLFNWKSQLIVKSKNKAYTFYNIAPLNNDELDYGVDLTGTVSVLDKTYDCALQVKFWNPYIKDNVITKDICSGLYMQSIEDEMASIKDSENMFICWLGDMKNVSKWLSKFPCNRHLVFIDRTVLKDNIDGDKEFWNKISIEYSQI